MNFDMFNTLLGLVEHNIYQAVADRLFAAMSRYSASRIRCVCVCVCMYVCERFWLRTVNFISIHGCSSYSLAERVSRKTHSITPSPLEVITSQTG
jgi:hypothetical protein